MEHALVNGLVLAGGRSTRMGMDKGLISYHGKPQREYLFESLCRLCSEVFTSCREGQNVPASLHPLTDAMDIQSPLNGILSAFRLYPEKAWLAVAVDLPNVSTAVLEALIAGRDPGRLATCFFNVSAGGPEPLLTIWEPAAYPWLAAQAGTGNISPRSFLRSSDVHVIHGMPDSVFHNVNDAAGRDRWLSKG